MSLQYESWLPFLGSLLFSVRRVPERIGEEVEIDRWFLRGISPLTAIVVLVFGL